LVTRAFAMGRFVSLAVTASLLSPPLVEIGHAARTAHVACPADGRFEDAPDAPALPPHSHSAGAVLPADHPADAHSHHACDATPAARLRIAAACASRSHVLQLALARSIVPACEPPRISAVDLIRIAPKLSPPLS
jgi:hypothetical protein